jgi:hypothetical protein
MWGSMGVGLAGGFTGGLNDAVHGYKAALKGIENVGGEGEDAFARLGRNRTRLARVHSAKFAAKEVGKMAMAGFPILLMKLSPHETTVVYERLANTTATTPSLSTGGYPLAYSYPAVFVSEIAYTYSTTYTVPAVYSTPATYSS